MDVLVLCGFERSIDRKEGEEEEEGSDAQGM